MTREEAINALVEQDVARWGEAERAASLRRYRNGYSIGRAINTLASRAELAGRPDPALRAEAERTLTDADWGWLRQGG